jgi:hypothetical protein
VIYVLGNHEYYKGSYPKTLNKIKAAAEESNVFVLENSFCRCGRYALSRSDIVDGFFPFGNPVEVWDDLPAYDE